MPNDKNPIDPPRIEKVSSLELFFDLVFAFAITQVSEIIEGAESAVPFVQALLALSLIWWMYGGYAWLTNNLSTSRTIYRLLMLLAMAGFLVMALTMPEAFGDNGLIFGLAYLVVNILHAVLFTRSHNASSARAILRIAPTNIGTALMVVIAGFTTGPVHWLLWIAAVVILVLTPLYGKIGGFALQPAHFVERHGLVLLIVLGESVISIGTSANGRALSFELVSTLFLCLAICAAIWWMYFTNDESRAEHGLLSVTGEARSRKALYAFGYWELVMIFGLVVMSAGVKSLVAAAGSEVGIHGAMLAGGLAVFLGAGACFLRVFRAAPLWTRWGGGVACLAAAGVGPWASGIAELVALLLILTIVLVVDTRLVKKNRLDHEVS